MRRAAVWVIVGAVALVVAVATEPAFVLAPLLGYGIYRVGTAMLRGMVKDARTPAGPPEPVLGRPERTLYWCEQCGAELLLVVRGADTAPRHCGERMHQRVELAKSDRR